MKKRDVIFIIGVIVLLFIILTITSYQYEELLLENIYLKEDNRLLKDRNHMLENCLENSEAQVEKISTTIDKLREEQNRGIEWNKNVEEF